MGLFDTPLLIVRGFKVWRDSGGSGPCGQDAAAIREYSKAAEGHSRA